MHRRLATTLILLAPLAFALPVVAQERIKAVTSFTILADMAANVAGDVADVVSITKPGAEIHNYQPTPGDLVAAQDADLILWNGLNLEQWFAQFLDNLPDVPSAVLTAGIEPMGGQEQCPPAAKSSSRSASKAGGTSAKKPGGASKK